MSFHPYLFFSEGTCREAFTRYQEIFGGELSIMTNGEAPEGAAMPGASADSVMHAAITLDGSLLMGSDDPTGDGGAKVGVAVTYSAPTMDRAQQVFDALAEGGEVTMPFGPVFWSEGFGSCTDRFGVQWMVDVAEAPADQS